MRRVELPEAVEANFLLSQLHKATAKEFYSILQKGTKYLGSYRKRILSNINPYADYICYALLGGKTHLNQTHFNQALVYLKNNYSSRLLIMSFEWIHKLLLTKNVNATMDDRAKEYLTAMEVKYPDLTPDEKNVLCDLLDRTTNCMMMSRQYYKKSVYGEDEEPAAIINRKFRYKLNPRFHTARYLLAEARHHTFFFYQKDRIDKQQAIVKAEYEHQIDPYRESREAREAGEKLEQQKPRAPGRRYSSDEY